MNPLYPSWNNALNYSRYPRGNTAPTVLPQMHYRYRGSTVHSVPSPRYYREILNECLKMQHVSHAQSISDGLVLTSVVTNTMCLVFSDVLRALISASSIRGNLKRRVTSAVINSLSWKIASNRSLMPCSRLLRRGCVYFRPMMVSCFLNVMSVGKH